MRREALSDALWAEAMPLLHAHWAEVAHYPDIPLDVDTEAYGRADEAGMVRCYTAREDLAPVDSLPGDPPGSKRVGMKLVGYALFFVRPNLHYQGSVQAVQDVLYLDPSCRGTGYRFVQWCDEQLRVQGVQVVYHHSKVAKPFGRLLAKQGYELIDEIWGNRLDKN